VRLTLHLADDEAKAVQAKVLGRAGRLTPGGLRSALARAVMEVAPKTARERRQAAARFARVERWAEDSGNAALMGRELPPDEVLACDQRICWWAGGRTVSAALPGWLTLHGVTRPVTITVSARRDGTAIEAAGSLPVASGRWGITLPAGFGFLGGLSSQATAEFLLILHRRG
jgi:hypothetical protein